MTDSFSDTLAGADALEGAMRELERSADRFGAAMNGALKGAVLEGRAFDDVLRTLAQRLAAVALDGALEPLEGALGGLVGELGSVLGSGLAGGVVPGAAGRGPAPSFAAAAPAVTFNVSTPDARSFQRSAGQISAMVARSTARGRRSL